MTKPYGGLIQEKHGVEIADVEEAISSDGTAKLIGQQKSMPLSSATLDQYVQSQAFDLLRIKL
jgi:hypothetical protein